MCVLRHEWPAGCLSCCSKSALCSLYYAVLSAGEIAVSVYEMIGLYTWTIENIAIWRVFSPRLGVRFNTSMAQMIAEAR